MPRPATSSLIGRALRLRCPRCGSGKMFFGLFRMHADCPHCHLHFEREPGYFLGSIYINYGIAALLTTVGWISLRFGMQVSPKPLLAALAAFCVAFGILFFRYARALWLALDLRFENDQFFDHDLTATESSHGNLR
ncbi:MAG: DUF983 domain-containing protein [Planctomycetales bacterium]